MTAQQILFRLIVVVASMAAIIGAIRFRQLPNNLRYLAVLTWFEALLELVGLIIGLRTGNNLFLIPIYTVGELALLTIVYDKTLQLPVLRSVGPWIVGLFTVYVLYTSLLVREPLAWVQPVQQVLQSLLVLILVGLYFQQLLNKLEIEKLSQEPMFWVSAGLAIYFFGYLQFGLFSNYILKNYSTQFSDNMWTISNTLNILLHFCYAYALWMRPQK